MLGGVSEDLLLVDVVGGNIFVEVVVVLLREGDVAAAAHGIISTHDLYLL